MQELISLALLVVLLLGAAVGLLLYGLVRRRKRSRYVAGACLGLAVLVAGWAVYRTSHKAYRHLTEAVRPRTGEEIYAALFGRPRPGCLQVIDYQDQVVPRIDAAIWLHYRTCPPELRRVLARLPYARRTVPTAALAAELAPSLPINWFAPRLLGDSARVYEYATPDNRNIRTLWASPDSTEVFYRDILD
jgi:hypothetical protein